MKRLERPLGLFACAVAVFLGATTLTAPRDVLPVEVLVDTKVVELASPSPTVRAALARAGRTPHDGALRSAKTGSVLDAHAHPAMITVDGAPTGLAHRLHEGALVAVTDGADSVEPTEARRADVAPPPGPDVESVLWYPGTPGVDEQIVGQVSGEVVESHRTTEPIAPRREEAQVVSLTFDDGPSPTFTPQVLQILADEGVHATFCLVGDMVRKRPELVRAIAAQGHTLCSHTMNHPENLDQLPADQAEREIVMGQEEAVKTIGQPITLFRAPGGRYNQGVLDVAHNHGMRFLYWTVDAEASAHRPPEELLARVQAGLKPGAVVLMHDGGGNRDTTVAMLRPLIDSLKAAGWGFGTPTSPPPPAAP